MNYATGPLTLFAAWAIHDVEEALTFPATADALADSFGVEQLRMDARQSWTAVGLMGLLVGFSCWRGARTKGESGLYRGMVAGLGAHVATHVAASAVRGGYTAGAVTAVSVMLPGVVLAAAELARPLRMRDLAVGMSVCLPAALASQILARKILPRATSIL
jgi:hypothetical protein